MQPPWNALLKIQSAQGPFGELCFGYIASQRSQDQPATSARYDNSLIRILSDAWSVGERSVLGQETNLHGSQYHARIPGHVQTKQASQRRTSRHPCAFWARTRLFSSGLDPAYSQKESTETP